MTKFKMVLFVAALSCTAVSSTSLLAEGASSNNHSLRGSLQNASLDNRFSGTSDSVVGVIFGHLPSFAFFVIERRSPNLRMAAAGLTVPGALLARFTDVASSQ